MASLRAESQSTIILSDRHASCDVLIESFCQSGCTDYDALSLLADPVI